jgi:hypothetical protein
MGKLSNCSLNFVELSRALKVSMTLNLCEVYKESSLSQLKTNSNSSSSTSEVSPNFFPCPISMFLMISNQS